LEAGREQGVTIWNSVPALLEMAVEYAGGRGEEWPGSMRQALLSGDWIPVALPGKARELAPQMKLDSLGGATEAAIWSIHYPIGEVEEGARSIPYGRGMVNQRFYVLDEWGEERPVWATGQLHIGGVGLARGYWRDEKRTKEQFWVHGRTGERLYKTGDLGRWLPDGNIEFLGREDAQVKIQGHRIELGEIEAALRTHAAVKEAVVTVLNSASGRRLAAYVVLDKNESVAAEPATASPNVILDTSARESFKHQALQLRSRDDVTMTIALSSETDAEAFYERCSHHAFRSEPLPFNNFSRFLGQLRQTSINGKPKYQYASAGGVYPVQLYLSVKPGRVEGLGGGIYYYHPVDHELHFISSTEIPESIHWPANREAFRNSAISLFLVAEKRAIEPLYGSKARDFCLIEAGILMQLLESSAPLCGMGNCQIGSVDNDRLRELLKLGSTQEIIHSSVAGYALPVAAMPSVQMPAMKHLANSPSVQALRRHLEGLLPAYMVPSAFAILDKLPLGSNGKVDRKSLPPIDEQQKPQPRAQVVAIDDVLGNKIAAAMSQELNGIVVDHNQNFFDLGATSLTLVRFANRLLNEHQIQAPIIDIFRYPTVAALVQRLAMTTAESPSLEAERARAARGHQTRSRLARAREAGQD
jgi:SagB-type dehydrogenase family enzyme